MSTPNTPAPKAPATPTPAQASQAPAPTKQEPPAPPRMMKLKLEGKEVEMSESDVIAFAQQGKVASQRFQEAAAMKKQAEEVLKYAKSNPKEFFERTGMNARQWAEEYLMQELQTEAMSPEQRKARENEEKLRKFEDEKKQQVEQQRKEQMKRLEDEHRANYDQIFTKALMDSGLPKTAFTVKRMAELQLLNVKNKFELSPQQLAKLVKEDYANEQKSLLSAFDGDQLMDFLGDDLVKKLSKAQIAKLKGKGNPTSSSTPTKTTRPAEGTGMGWKEYQKRNRRRP